MTIFRPMDYVSCNCVGGERDACYRGLPAERKTIMVLDKSRKCSVTAARMTLERVCGEDL